MKLPIGTLGIIGLVALAPVHAVLTAQAPKTVADGVYTDAQAKRGTSVYEANCASCHGANLAGTEQAPPLTGPGFLMNWVDTTASDLFQKINVAMPADDPGKLTPEQTADVLAYIFSSNKYKTGSAELSKDAQELQGIKIVAPK